MTPLAYLFYSLSHRCYHKKAWITSVFSITQESTTQQAIQYPGKLIREPFGLFYLDDALARQPIELDAKQLAHPLFNKNQPVTLTPAQLPFTQNTEFLKDGSLETTVGRLLLNLLVVFEPFQGRMAYINTSFGPSVVEKRMAPVLQDALKPDQSPEPGKYYVNEAIQFCKAVTFVETLSFLFSQSVTRAAMLPPPGRQAFKKEVLSRYEGKLRDPIEMAKFQEELKQFDLAYLKAHDPAFGKFTSGKTIDARGKAFLTQGGEANEFTGQMDVTPIVKSLDEGIDLNPESFTATGNTIRYGSFSRGAETVNGGVVAKALMTALDTWQIVEGDCGTTLCVQRQYDAKEVKNLINRYVIEQGKPRLVENQEQANAFAGKVVFIRSPQYCRKPGTHTCRICAGEVLAKYPTGQVIPSMEVSSGIMTDSLKKMHTTSISTNTMDLNKAIR